MKSRRSSSERSLHGNAPDRCPVALLLIDLINDLDFPGAERLAPHARRAAERLTRLKERAERAGVPCVYVNDNFGRWRSDFRAQVRHCMASQTPGSEVCALLRPGERDYFVLKPKHSGFYNTCLDLLLEHLNVELLVMAGIATDNCVTFTANDGDAEVVRMALELKVDDGVADFQISETNPVNRLGQPAA